MHLAVNAAQYAVVVEYRGGVVIEPGGPPLEKRPNHHHAMLTRGLRQLCRGWPRNWLRQVEQGSVFPLTEVLRLEELRQTHYLGPAPGGFTDTVQRLGQILLRFRPAGHLHQSYAKHLQRQIPRSRENDAPE